MRALIVSRIFAPEVAAAAFRLRALALALRDRGYAVQVITARPPRGVAERDANTTPGVDVRRWPVIRDRNGQVRGYVSYASFDLGAVLRVLVARRADVIVTEPPPTTAWLTSLIARLRRVPHVYYSADCSSDAVRAAGVSPLIARIVFALERSAIRQSTLVLTVNPAIADRLRELHPGAQVVSVGNGVDTDLFGPTGPVAPSGEASVLYAGTVSEWQRAGVVLDAWPRVMERHPEARLVIVGSGTDWEELRRRSRADAFGGTVDVLPPEPPSEVAARFRGARLSVVTLTPGIGYDYAVPTKLMAALCTGTPVIFAGDGASADVVAQIPEQWAGGQRVRHDSDALADAIGDQLARARGDRTELAAWAAERFSLSAVAGRAVDAIEAARPRPSHERERDEVGQ